MLLKHKPENLEVLTAMGAFYLDTGRLHLAQEFYEKAMKQDNQNVSAYVGLAEIFLTQQDPEKAIQQIRKFRQTTQEKTTQETNLRIKLILGRAYLLQGDFRQALSQLQDVVDYLPGLLLGQYSYAMAQAGVGNFEQAIAAYKKALQIHTTHLPSMLNLAIAYYKNKNLEDALSYTKQVLTLNPQYIEAIDLYGLLLAEQGQYEQALQQFTRAEQLASRRTRESKPPEADSTS